MSSLWSSLSKPERITKTDEEIQNENLSVDMGFNNKDLQYFIEEYENYGNRDFYYLVDKENIQKINLRLKPFITAYGRYIMGTIAYKHLNDVIRIQCDGIALKNHLKQKMMVKQGLMNI